MTRRDRTAYADMAARQPAPARAGQDISQPVAGFFRFKLGGGSVAGGVRIWFGPPHDPVTGEELDRSWRWQAHFNGEPVDFDRVWPSCTGEPITQIDYSRLCARTEWARRIAADTWGLTGPNRQAVINGEWDDIRQVRCALAAIIETSERAAKYAAACPPDESRELIAAIRKGDHLDD